MTGKDLIMQLTLEQGPGRITQVQPPLQAWRYYFKVNLSNPPDLRLKNKKSSKSPIQIRPVVEHDHNWTVEINGAQIERPAIIRFRRVGASSYEYWIYGQNDTEFEHCNWLLNNFPNPRHNKGRKWLII
jgi:hypothetical protein